MNKTLVSTKRNGRWGSLQNQNKKGESEGVHLIAATVVTTALPLHGGVWGLVIKKWGEGGRSVILAHCGTLPVVVVGISNKKGGAYHHGLHRTQYLWWYCGGC